MPMTRGMEAACYVKMAEGVTVADLRQCLEVSSGPVSVPLVAIWARQRGTSNWLTFQGCSCSVRHYISCHRAVSCAWCW